MLLELKQSLVAQGQNFDKFSNLTRQSVENLSINVVKLETACGDIKLLMSNTLQVINELKDVINDKFSHLSKENRINRWILIIGFIVLAIMQFV